MNNADVLFTFRQIAGPYMSCEVELPGSVHDLGLLSRREAEYLAASLEDAAETLREFIND